MAMLVTGEVSLYMAYLILFTVITALSIGASQRGCGIKCFSFSCRHNKGGRCSRKEIAVYDNTVEGLCLSHTSNMKDRVLEPMRETRLLERYEHETYVVADALKKTQEDMKDEELLKNPNAFARWMKRHCKRG